MKLNSVQNHLGGPPVKPSGANGDHVVNVAAADQANVNVRTGGAKTRGGRTDENKADAGGVVPNMGLFKNIGVGHVKRKGNELFLNSHTDLLGGVFSL